MSGAGVFDPLSDESDDVPNELRKPFNENGEAIKECFGGAPKGETRARLEFLSPLDLMKFEVPEDYMMIGDYHLSRGEVCVIGGAPGVGKSRAGTALAIAGATGKDWFGFKTHRHFKTLILQNENGRVRLKSEFEGMGSIDAKDIDDYIRVSPPPPMGMDFENKDFRGDLKVMLKEFRPDVLILDPWNAVSKDDNMRAYADAYEQIKLSLPHENPPALVIVAHTRKPRVGEKANGRALLNLLAGSYLLGSVARSVFILQSATDSPEDQRVVFTCCKNNNGQLGKRTAWTRCNGLFDAVQEFNWEEFDGGGKPSESTVGKVTDDHIRALFDFGGRQLPKREAVTELMRIAGCGQTKAYDALKLEGDFAKHLRWDKKKKELKFVDESRSEREKQGQMRLDTPNEK